MSLSEYFKVGEVYWVKDRDGRYGLVRVEKLDDQEGRVLGRDVHDALVPWPVYWSDRPAHRMPKAGIYTGALHHHVGWQNAEPYLDAWEIEMVFDYGSHRVTDVSDTPEARRESFDRFYREPRAEEVW